jgi:catechol 2,3-dioxygenase-like lactoylglutathione lyase family enzyme
VCLGTLGLFTISMAAGLGTEAGGWPIGAVGAAMVVVAVALLTTASMRGGDKTFVGGIVHVMKVSDPPLIDAEFGRCEMQVLVDSPSHPGQTVMIRDPRVPVAKWPEVGDTLPALIAVSDVRRIRIQWDRVGAYGEPYEAPYLEEEEVFEEAPPPDVTAEFPSVPVEPLPRRRPSPSASETEAHPVAVLEGELVPVGVPSPRQLDEDETPVTVEALSFSDVPEPAVPTPATAGPVFQEDPAGEVLATQPPARPASAGSIHGVGITILVSELGRSLRFYHDMLGFYEIDGGPDSVVLASGDTRIVLMTAADAVPVHRRQVHLNLEVGDVEAVYQELKVRGVKFTYPPRMVNRGERLELVAAAFRDPDGNGIAITQWKARST